MPSGLKIDSTSVYWGSFDVAPSESFSGSVRKVGCYGGSSEVMVSLSGPFAGHIAIDATNLYWSASTTVMKVPLNGDTPTTLAEGQSNAGFIAVDATSVYWTDSTAATVMKVALDGGTPTTLASGQDRPRVILVDAANVYWMTANSVMKVALDGGTPVTLATQERLQGRLAVDATSAYFTNPVAGTVMKVALEGGSLTTLASEQGAPCAIAVDSTNVYWATVCEAVLQAAPARLMKVPLAGGTPSEVSSFRPRTGLLDFTIHGANVYVAWTPAVYRGSVGRFPLE